jgi:hypothetical protein
VRQADVVGVHVRDDDAQDRQAFELGGEHLLPLRLGLVAADAAVDHRPAGAAVQLVAQQPQVDVVQREGQAMRIQRTPGATSIVAPERGQGVAQG